MTNTKLETIMDAILDKINTASADDIRQYTKAYGDLFACASYGADPMLKAFVEHMRSHSQNPFDGMGDED